MTRILSCDTAHGTCSVALLVDGNISKFYKDEEKSRQAEKLFSLIDQALGRYQYDDIDALAINIGPGSFTGIRVGLAALKGLKIVTKLPLIAVTSLQALQNHASTLKPEQPLTAIIDAGRKQVYMQSFDANGTVSEATLANVDELSEITGLVTGNGSELIRETNDIKIIGKALPDASDIALCAYTKWKQQNVTSLETDGGDILPLYLRAPDAKKMKTA